MTQDIKNTLVAIGDSFTDYPYTWANHLAACLDMPLVKFSVGGASNKTILHNFYSHWFFNNLNFENCIVIYQSTHMSREDVHISDGARGHKFFKENKLGNIFKQKPKMIKEIFGKTYLLSGYRNYVFELPGILEEVDPLRDFCFQINLLNTALKVGNNKFLFLLGLHNAHTSTELDFSTFPLNCETLAYTKNGIAHGIDQYVIDINQIDETKHPSFEGHKSITDNLVLPKLRELKWTTK